jgi:hypothetical protein
VLFLHNTSHVDDEPYPKLLQEKGFGGFPSLCFMDAEGNVLFKQPGNERSVAAFEKSLPLAVENMGRRKALVDKAKAGDAAAQKELFLEDLKSGQLTAAQIKEGAKKVTLSKEEQAQVDQTLTDFEVKEILMGARGTDQAKAAGQIAAMAKQGRRPTKALALNFWSLALTHAATAKDVKLAEEAFGELEKASDGKAQDRVKDRWKKQLEEAKEPAKEQAK